MRGGPRYSGKSAALTLTGHAAGVAPAVATRAATFRAMAPTCRSRLRTPASRVYCGDHRPQCLVFELDGVGREPVFRELPGNQVAARDVDLFFFGVPGERDDLHPVEQGRMHGAELVGRGDEEDAREVVVDLEVVVAERVVLGRVEDLEERGSGVALEADAHLVDLVEHEDGVGAAGLLQRLDDPPGERADVGPAVTADFRLVADAAKGDPHELPVHGARDRLAERRFSHPGGADEAEDRPLHVALQLPHREVLDDPFLDLVEVVVILVQDLPRLDEVQAILGGLRPRDVENPVQVRPDHLVFRRGRRHPLEAIHLTLRHAMGILRQRSIVDAPAQVRDLGSFLLPKLLLDRLQLLPQVVLTLRVGHFLLRLRFDLALQFEKRDLARERAGHRLELHHEPVLFEELLLVLDLHVDQAAHEVREPHRLVDAHDDRAKLLRQAAGEVQGAIDLLAQRPDVRLDLDRLFLLLGQHREPCREDAVLARDVTSRARDAFDEHVEARSARRLRHLADDADSANWKEITRLRIVGLGLLQREEDHAVAAERSVDRLDRHGAIDGKRLNGQREEDGAAKRDDRKLVGELLRSGGLHESIFSHG